MGCIDLWSGPRLTRGVRVRTVLSESQSVPFFYTSVQWLVMRRWHGDALIDASPINSGVPGSGSPGTRPPPSLRCRSRVFRPPSPSRNRNTAPPPCRRPKTGTRQERLNGVQTLRLRIWKLGFIVKWIACCQSSPVQEASRSPVGSHEEHFSWTWDWTPEL